MLPVDPGELGVYLGLYVATTVTSRTGFTFCRLASQFLYTFLLLLFLKEGDRLPVTLLRLSSWAQAGPVGRTNKPSKSSSRQISYLI